MAITARLVVCSISLYTSSYENLLQLFALFILPFRHKAFGYEFEIQNYTPAFGHCKNAKVNAYSVNRNLCFGFVENQHVPRFFACFVLRSSVFSVPFHYMAQINVREVQVHMLGSKT